MGNHFFKAAPDVPVKVFIFYIDNSTLNRKVYNQQVYIYMFLYTLEQKIEQSKMHFIVKMNQSRV